MARGLCFQSLCAVIAVLVAATVRSAHVTNQELQGRMPSTNSAHNQIRRGIERIMYGTVRRMMDNLYIKMNKTDEEFIPRLDYLRHLGVFRLQRNLSQLSNVGDLFGSTLLFSQMLKKVVKSSRIRTAHQHIIGGLQSDLNHLRDKQQVMAYQTAYDISKSSDLRNELQEMPDNIDLFQTVFPVHLMHSAVINAGLVQMDVGPARGTVAVCNKDYGDDLRDVVCRQIGRTSYYPQ